jgi:hypothetical protein
MDEGTPGAILALVQGAVAHVVSRNAGGVYKPWIAEFSYTYIVNGEYFPVSTESGFATGSAQTTSPWAGKAAC